MAGFGTPPMMSMSTMNMVMLTKVQKKTIKKNL